MHNCEWLSICCYSEPGDDLEANEEGIIGLCSECGLGSKFDCEEHPLGEDYNGVRIIS